MKNLKNLALILGSALVLGSSAQAANVVVNFDDVATSATTGYGALGNYAGFNWVNTGVYNGGVFDNYVNSLYTSPVIVDSGYRRGAVSQSNVAFNLHGITSRTEGSAFNFVGADFTAAWNHNLHLIVKGLLNGVVLYTNEITPGSGTTLQTIDTAGPQFLTFNYNGIDELAFTTYDGQRDNGLLTTFGLNAIEQNPGIDVGFTGEHFAMDNFTYDIPTPPAPEPSSIILGAMGLGSMLKLRKKVSA